MLGHKTSTLYRGPCRWLYRLWGVPDINARQKWSALWPYLHKLSEPLRLLDAGCGGGIWSLELAARFPAWQVIGLDKNPDAIQIATQAKERLGLANVSFICDDFLTYQASETYDLVLSVASAHYLVSEGKGKELFCAFHSWLRPGGKLLLLGPRCRDEVPSLGWLPAPMSKLRDVFSERQLHLLCQDAEFSIEELRPAVFALGTFAKQLSSLHRLVPVLVPLLYFLEWGLTTSERVPPFRRDGSAYWVLIARRD